MENMFYNSFYKETNISSIAIENVTRKAEKEGSGCSR